MPIISLPPAGNLPYYITSPILERVFNLNGAWQRAVFLVQAEVAGRIAAGPGSRDFGYLSVLVQTHARAEILFPVGRITTLSGDTLPLASGMLRISLAAVLIAVSLLGLAAIGVFISTLTDVPVGAMAGTLGVFIMVGVLDTLPQTRALHPWLFTDHWLSYTDLMRTHIQWDGIVKNLSLQALYVGVFGAATWARFTSKDILA